MDKDAVLGQRPPGATQVEQWADCDRDQGFAYAGRDYRSDLTAQNPPPRTDALVITTSILCFDKEIDGTTAQLGISFPSDLNMPSHPENPDYPKDEFSIELRADHDEEYSCRNG